MSWTTEIITDINRIEADEWNQLTKERPFATWQWLQLTQAVVVDHQPRYVLLRENGELQAAAVCYLQSRFHSRVLQLALGWLPRAFPILRCAIPISYDPGLLFSDQQPLEKLLPELLNSVQTLLRQERASFYSFDHLAPTDPIWLFLKAQGYHRVEHLIETYLDIKWAMFEDYLGALSRKKRTEYVRIRGRLERENITIGVADPLSEDGVLLKKLVHNVFQRHADPDPYSADLFAKAGALLGENFKLVVARQNGDCIGCFALLRSGTEWTAKWAGLDYERTLDTGTYYGLLAESVRQTILSGGTRLRMGATAYQTKQHFGVTVEERIGAMAVRVRSLHWLAGKIMNFTSNSEIVHQAIPKASAPTTVPQNDQSH